VHFKRKLDYAAMLGFVIRIADIIAIAGSGWLCYLVRFDFMPGTFPAGYLAVIGVQAVLVVAVFSVFQVYDTWWDKVFLQQLTKVVQAWGIAFLTLLGIAFLTKTGALFSREWAIIWFFAAGLCLLLLRLSVREILIYSRKRRLNIKKIIIIGANALGGEIARRIQTNPSIGLDVVGFFDEGADSALLNGISVESLDRLHAFKQHNNVEEIWIALSLAEEEKINRVLKKLEHCTLNIRYIPNLASGNKLFNQPITQILGMTTVNLSVSPMTDSNRIIKWLEDKLLAALILMAISPVMLVIAIGVKLSSPGPVIYKQKRHGWDGRVFNVYKFRSMKVHREAAGKVTQACPGDSRITPFGALLRKLNLDELPQFFNVLQGRMSIVGPRPHAVEHNDYYKNEIECFMRRHKVKPGITGWAQINGWRGETDTLEKMQKRVEYDLFYIEHWSLLFDLKIILLTVLRSFADEHAY
jgi:putative colanic acid biosynthesis UDP-glucose lipid carrier transferase